MITMTPGQLWFMVVGLAACAGAAWILLSAAWRVLARRWRAAGQVLAAATAPEAAPPARPHRPGQVTLFVPPCGCIHTYHRVSVEPCPQHAARAAEHAEINRLDRQMRGMP